MKNRVKYAAVAIAMAFVTMTAPVRANPVETGDDGTCYACEMCYEEISCLSCGVMAMTAISGCCGMGGGTTYCVPEYGGFAVNCDNRHACQCGIAGDGCMGLVSGG